METIFIVENKSLFKAAAERAEEEETFGDIHKVLTFKSDEVNKAISYIKNRIRMSDGDEFRFMIFGFDDVNFSKIKDRKGEPIVKYKGIVQNNKKGDKS